MCFVILKDIKASDSDASLLNTAKRVVMTYYGVQIPGGMFWVSLNRKFVAFLKIEPEDRVTMMVILWLKHLAQERDTRLNSPYQTKDIRQKNVLSSSLV